MPTSMAKPRPLLPVNRLTTSGSVTGFTVRNPELSVSSRAPRVEVLVMETLEEVVVVSEYNPSVEFPAAADDHAMRARYPPVTTSARN